ncbi:MAG: TetR/AcrR family transcriptional regulator [Solirubrobacteraceae bacterium]
MIDETVSATPSRRPTRAQQRVATRIAIVEATVACLVEEGYSAFTTRRVAERAGIAQSTLMHHFDARETLLIEAVTHIAMQLADRALDAVDLAALRTPKHREDVLDEAWRVFTTSEALAAAQLWVAAWTEPELAGTLRELEERISAILIAAAQALFPERADDPRLLALIDAAVSLIRGLVMAIPVWGQRLVDARWQAIKPILLEAAAQLLDEDRAPVAPIVARGARGRASSVRREQVDVEDER